MKVLIIEDDPVVRVSLERSLAFEGHEVVTASDWRSSWPCSGLCTGAVSGSSQSSGRLSSTTCGWTRSPASRSHKQSSDQAALVAVLEL